MSPSSYDVIVIGSGAGGMALTYKLVRANKRVLLIEKGPRLVPERAKQGSNGILDSKLYRSQEIWNDRQGKRFIPQEYCNVGGKTKWYGAALLRLAPDEFVPDPTHRLFGWPFRYEELAAYYEEVESLLGVQKFANEPCLQKLAKAVCSTGGWHLKPLPLALKPEILKNEREAKNFDGFASAAGYKCDAENGLLERIADSSNLFMLTGTEVVGFQFARDHPDRIRGVVCSNGKVFLSRAVVLAAGAMTSPRLLQKHLDATKLTLPCDVAVGANFKRHLVSTILAFTPTENHDVLRKTAMFLNGRFKHSSVQCLGWLDEDKMAARLPDFVPKPLVRLATARVSQFFVMTEEGSHPDNRVIFSDDTPPILDYDISRLPEAWKEHCAARRSFAQSLRKARSFVAHRFMRIDGTSHAVGTLVAGNDPRRSIIDSDGKIHGMQGLYVGDGSALPRPGRVNPGLTIFAWGLRIGSRLAQEV